MVTKSFFGTLEDHERPAILRLSLRLQVLLICCAESKAISDPKGMVVGFWFYENCTAHFVAGHMSFLFLYKYLGLMS